MKTSLALLFVALSVIGCRSAHVEERRFAVDSKGDVPSPQGECPSGAADAAYLLQMKMEEGSPKVAQTDKLSVTYSTPSGRSGRWITARGHSDVATSVDDGVASLTSLDVRGPGIVVKRFVPLQSGGKVAGCQIVLGRAG